MNDVPDDPSPVSEPIPACDLLRNLANVGTPDPRYPKVGARQMTLEDHWQDIATIALNEGVPRRIGIHFDTARNLLLYSWFVFRFQQVAEMHAYASVEYALRVRAGLPSRSKATLRTLLPKALKGGWIRDDGFRHYRHAADQRAAFVELEAAVTGREPEASHADGQYYARTLARSLPTFRNDLAHGSTMMRPSGKQTLALCCDLINQLFPA
jgi:hypothetical protein